MALVPAFTEKPQQHEVRQGISLSLCNSDYPGDYMEIICLQYKLNQTPPCLFIFCLPISGFGFKYELDDVLDQTLYTAEERFTQKYATKATGPSPQVESWAGWSSEFGLSIDFMFCLQLSS